jgi:hypothetical protein
VSAPGWRRCRLRKFDRRLARVKASFPPAVSDEISVPHPDFMVVGHQLPLLQQAVQAILSPLFPKWLVPRWQSGGWCAATSSETCRRARGHDCVLLRIKGLFCTFTGMCCNSFFSQGPACNCVTDRVFNEAFSGSFETPSCVQKKKFYTPPGNGVILIWILERP